MKKLKIDLFKISVIIILLGFLYVFYEYSQNGRFEYNSEGFRIIDTRTGDLYYYNNSGGIEPFEVWKLKGEK